MIPTFDPIEKFLYRVTITHPAMPKPFVSSYEAANEYAAHSEAVADFVRKTQRTVAGIESVHIVKVEP